MKLEYEAKHPDQSTLKFEFERAFYKQFCGQWPKLGLRYPDYQRESFV